jgi:hypothetical protein
MISIGMSNTNAEFDTFSQLARADDQVNPRVILVNGALGGQTAEKWTDPNALTWQALNDQLVNYQLSPQQVQVAWVKQTLTRGGDFPAKAEELQGNLESIARNLKTHFPNLQIAFFSSRTRSYTYYRGLSPEPLAFETGFSVKWMIEKQINGDADLNFDPGRGEVKAPYLSWGPYLWADGQNPRSDGFTWLPGDMTADCTHPSPSGRQKVAGLLLDFFKNDTLTRGWFLADPGLPPVTPTSANTPNPSVTATLPARTPTAVRTSTATQVLPIVSPTPSSPPPNEPRRDYKIYMAVILVTLTGLRTGWWLVGRKR